MVCCFMLVFGVAIGTSLYSQAAVLIELKAEEQRLQSQLDAEMYKNIQLKNQQEYYVSNAYIEKVAREQLGYVMSDEVVFKNREQ